MLNHPSIHAGAGGKIHFTSFFRKYFDHFICILLLIFREYFVFTKSKIQKQFLTQTDLHCRFS